MNLLPGAGLGFSGAKLIAFGLGAVVVIDQPEIPGVTPPGLETLGGTGGPMYSIYDNAYSHQQDDEFLLIFSTIIPQVIE